MVKVPPAPIVTEDATTPSTASVCSEELNQGSEELNHTSEELNQLEEMPGTPQSMSGFEGNGTHRSCGSQMPAMDSQCNPTSPNVEQMNVMLGQPLVSPMCTTVVLGLPAPVPSPTGNMVCVNMPPMAAPPVAGQAQQSYYRVAYVGGIDVRTGPSVNAPKTGMTMRQNEIFAVAETVSGASPDDLRVYLRLADGRGWVFDDKALHPNDPSVVRGHWQPQPMAAPPPQQYAPPQQFAAVPVMGMAPHAAGYPMAPLPHPYPAQPIECGAPYYPMYAEHGQMPPQHFPHQEMHDPSQMCYPPLQTEQAPRKWKRGKRGGAKRRPKTQLAASTTEVVA